MKFNTITPVALVAAGFFILISFNASAGDCGGDLDCYENCRDTGKTDKQCQGYGWKNWFDESYAADRELKRNQTVIRECLHLYQFDMSETNDDSLDNFKQCLKVRRLLPCE